MAHQFSVEIHGYLTSAVEAAERELKDAREKAQAERVAYLEGRLDELQHLRQMLTAKYDLRFHKYY